MTIPHSTEPMVITRARQRDTEAFAILYTEHWKKLHHLIRRRLKFSDDSLAEDLTSETFLRAWRSIDSYIWTGADFGAWLTTIAGNLLKDHYRRLHTRNETPMAEVLDLILTTTPDIEQSYITRERAKEVLSSMPENRRAIFFLEAWKDMTRFEIGEHLGIPSATVGTRKHRTIKSLREEIE